MLLQKFLSRKKLSRKYRSIFGLKNQSCDRRKIIFLRFLFSCRFGRLPRFGALRVCNQCERSTNIKVGRDAACCIVERPVENPKILLTLHNARKSHCTGHQIQWAGRWTMWQPSGLISALNQARFISLSRCRHRYCPAVGGKVPSDLCSSWAETRPYTFRRTLVRSSLQPDVGLKRSAAARPLQAMQCF